MNIFLACLGRVGTNTRANASLLQAGRVYKQGYQKQINNNVEL